MIHRLLQRTLRLRRKLAAIELLVCDVDGVLTDGGLHYDEHGQVMKRFDVRDGLAIRMLQRAGIEVAFLSGGRSGAIEQRARHLNVNHCLVGVGDKLSALRKLQASLLLERQQTAFIGDDLNDLTVRSATGLLICPADAVHGLRSQADWILSRRGGDGAVREFSEALLHSKNKFNELQNVGWFDNND